MDPGVLALKNNQKGIIMSLAQIKQNLSVSNISDAYNSAIESVKQQPTYIQAAVAGAALAAIAIITASFVSLGKKIYSWNQNSKPLDPVEISKAELAYKEAQNVNASLVEEANQTQKEFDAAIQADSTKDLDPKSQLKKKQAEKKLELLQPINEAAKAAVEDAKTAVANLTEELKKLSDAKAAAAKTDATPSEKSAANAAIRAAVLNINAGKAEIKAIQEKYLDIKNHDIDVEEEAFKRQIKEDESQITNPLNFIRNNFVPLTVAAISGALVAAVHYEYEPPYSVKQIATGVAAFSGVCAIVNSVYLSYKHAPASTAIDPSKKV